MRYSDRAHDVKPRPIKAATPIVPGETMADYVARLAGRTAAPPAHPMLVMLDVDLLARPDR